MASRTSPRSVLSQIAPHRSHSRTSVTVEAISACRQQGTGLPALSWPTTDSLRTGTLPVHSVPKGRSEIKARNLADKRLIGGVCVQGLGGVERPAQVGRHSLRLATICREPSSWGLPPNEGLDQSTSLANQMLSESLRHRQDLTRLRHRESPVEIGPAIPRAKL